MMQDPRERVLEMQALFDEVLEQYPHMEKAVETLDDFLRKVHTLEEYYTSETWREDYLADEEGRFADIENRGILSQDALYDFLMETDELQDRILGLTEDEE